MAFTPPMVALTEIARPPKVLNWACAWVVASTEKNNIAVILSNVDKKFLRFIIHHFNKDSLYR
jgi:hypothetical protein